MKIMQTWPTIASFFRKIYGVTFTCSMLLSNWTWSVQLNQIHPWYGQKGRDAPQLAACKTHRPGSARNTWIKSITSSWRRPIFRKSYDCDYIYVYCCWLMYTFNMFMWYVWHSQMTSVAFSLEAKGYLLRYSRGFNAKRSCQNKAWLVASEVNWQWEADMPMSVPALWGGEVSLRGKWQFLGC